MRESRARILAVGLGLFVLALAIHWPAVDGAFLAYDDDQRVVANPMVQRGFTPQTVAWAFTSLHAANWTPVTWLSHMLDVRLFGLEPWGHHLSSVLLHAANAALVFLAWRRLTGAPWRSAAVAALFAAHPIHVESVAWVAERKDVLSSCFGWLALLAWAVYAERPRPGPHLAACAALAISLSAKPTWVTLPFALLLLDFWPLRRVGRVAATRLLLEKAPLAALSVASGLITLAAQSRWGNVQSLGELPLALRFGNACLAYVAYLGSAVWPSALAVPYPHPGLELSLPRVAIALAGLGAATALALRQAKVRPWLATGWLWYLGTLVPMIGLVQVGSQARADRYSYLPLVGIYVALVWSAAEAAARGRVPPRLAAGLFAGVVAALAVATRAQIAHWRNSVALFERALAVTGPNPVAHVLLAKALAAEGRFDAALVQLDRAELDYAAETQVLRAGVLVELHRDAEAAAAAQAALALAPGHPEALFHLGLVRQRAGRLPEAVALYREALRGDPDGLFVQARHNLAVALARLGDRAGARREFEAVLRVSPGYEPSLRALERLAPGSGAPGAPAAP
jgi:tetratricopeptide (TPR) repeat protein